MSDPEVIERSETGGSAPRGIDDEALWHAFHDRTLPAAQWTHAAHLRVASLRRAIARRQREAAVGDRERMGSGQRL